MSFEELKEVFVDTLNCDADKVTMEASPRAGRLQTMNSPPAPPQTRCRALPHELPFYCFFL